MHTDEEQIARYQTAKSRRTNAQIVSAALILCAIIVVALGYFELASVRDNGGQNAAFKMTEAVRTVMVFLLSCVAAAFAYLALKRSRDEEDAVVSVRQATEIPPNEWPSLPFQGVNVALMVLAAGIATNDFIAAYNRALTSAMNGRPDYSGQNLRGIEWGRRGLRGANLERADLYASNLSGSDLRISNLSKANLTKAILQGADLEHADIRFAQFVDAILDGCDLRGSIAIEADFTNATLSGAKMADANLSNANLTNAKLETSDLRAARLISANLKGANLRGANVSMAVFLSAKNLDVDQIREAENWQEAVFDDEFAALLGLRSEIKSSTGTKPESLSSH